MILYKICINLNKKTCTEIINQCISNVYSEYSIERPCLEEQTTLLKNLN